MLHKRKCCLKYIFLVQNTIWYARVTTIYSMDKNYTKNAYNIPFSYDYTWKQTLSSYYDKPFIPALTLAWSLLALVFCRRAICFSRTSLLSIHNTSTCSCWASLYLFTPTITSGMTDNTSLTITATSWKVGSEFFIA